MKNIYDEMSQSQRAAALKKILQSARAGHAARQPRPVRGVIRTEGNVIYAGFKGVPKTK